MTEKHDKRPCVTNGAKPKQGLIQYGGKKMRSELAQFLLDQGLFAALLFTMLVVPQLLEKWSIL